MCRHLFSFRRENGLDLFTASDVPQHHNLATYMYAEDGIDNRPLTLSTVPVERRVLIKNKKFRKAKDALGDICNVISEFGQESFECHLDMFKGILEAVKRGKNLVCCTR